MKKLKLFSLLVVLLASLFVCTQGVFAAEITGSKYENNRIQLSGTGEKQVQIVLFDLEDSPVYMTTAAVENGKFSITLPEIAGLKNGNYTIKVADYDGKNVASKEISITSGETYDGKNVASEEISITSGETKDTTATNNMKTGDEIALYLLCILLFIASGAVLTFLGIKKNAKKAQNS